MCEKDITLSPMIDFKDVTPKMLINSMNLPPLYEKAFLSTDEKSMTEYAQNTTTWD